MANGIIMEPMDLGAWDSLLEEQPSASFFHTSAWIRVLAETYGYQPLSLLRREAGRSSAVMPLLEVRSFLTGVRGVSLPFSDFCAPFLGENVAVDEVLMRLRTGGRDRGWKYFEVRGSGDLAVPSSASYYHHDLDLFQGMEKYASELRASTVRNIRTAEKRGITVTISDALRSLQQFVQLNYLTRREHGLPPQPGRFFQKIHEHIHARGKGVTVLAFSGGIPVAGAVFFHYRDQAVYKFGAFNRAYQHLRANNKIMWEAIQWYAGKGYRHFSFGRTEPENEGLLQFKRGWGARETKVHYCKYDLRQDAFVQDAPPHRTAYGPLMTRMPLPVLRLAGAVFYKHAG